MGDPVARGPSATVPGAIDVDLGDGTTVAVDPEAVARFFGTPAATPAAPAPAPAGLPPMGSHTSVPADVQQGITFGRPGAIGPNLELPPMVPLAPRPEPRRGGFNDPGAAQGQAPAIIARPVRTGGTGVRMPQGNQPIGRAAEEALGTFEAENTARAPLRSAVEQGQRQREEVLGAAETQDALLQQEAQVAEEERSRRVRQAEDGLQQMRQSFASQRIDPGQFWADKGDLGKFSAALAIGVAEFARTFTGGDNPAMTIINDAIENNIQSQMANLDVQRETLGSAERDVSRMLDGFDDERTRENALRVQHWDQAARQLDAIGRNTQDAETLSNIDAMREQINRARLSAEMEFQQAANEAALRRAQAAARGARRSTLMEAVLPGVGPVRWDPNKPADVARVQELMQRAGVGGQGGTGVTLSALEPHQQQQVIERTTQDMQQLARLNESVARLSRSIPQSGDVPGVGRFAGRMPEMVTSSEGRNVRADLTDAVSSLLRIESGAAITPQEVRNEFTRLGIEVNFDEDTGSIDFVGDEDSLRRGVATLVERARGAESAVRARSPEAFDVVSQRQQRGGRPASFSVEE